MHYARLAWKLVGAVASLKLANHGSRDSLAPARMDSSPGPPPSSGDSVGKRVTVYTPLGGEWVEGVVEECTPTEGGGDGVHTIKVAFDDGSHQYFDRDTELKAGRIKFLAAGNKRAAPDTMRKDKRASNSPVGNETWPPPVSAPDESSHNGAASGNGPPSAPHNLLAAAAAVVSAGDAPLPAPLHVLEEPVTLACGHNFELKALQERVQSGAGGCSMCGEALPEHFTVNREVQRMVSHFRAMAQRPQGAGGSPGFAGQGGHPNRSLAAAAAAIADGVFGTDGGEEETPAEEKKEKGERPKFQVTCLLGRDTQEVEAMMATRFASLLASVMSRTSFNNTDLPLSLTKRVMKQDAFDIRPRTVSADAAALMEFATELFVGLVTAIAWQVATQPAKRNTLVLRDLGSAVGCSRTLDFLVDVVVNFGAELEIGAPNAKQQARIEARRQEKQLALGRMVLLNPHGSRKLVARRRQRGLHGRFLGSAESDAIDALFSSGSGPSPQAMPAAVRTDSDWGELARTTSESGPELQGVPSSTASDPTPTPTPDVASENDSPTVMMSPSGNTNWSVRLPSPTSAAARPGPTVTATATASTAATASATAAAAAIACRDFGLLHLLPNICTQVPGLK